MELRERDGIWYLDSQTPTCTLSYKVKRILFMGETRYQRVEVVETYDYGKCLIIDGKIQSSTSDEWVYHEALVHPSMVSHPSPLRVLMVGGGEGATLREVLKHSPVREAVMVDLDREVIEIVKKYMAELPQGSFENPKVKLYFEDGRSFLERQPDGSFDVIIVDVTDPLEGSPSIPLYTKEFYEVARAKLTDAGLIVTQASPLYYNLDCHARIYRTMATVFPVACSYRADVPSYVSSWGFVAGSKGPNPAALTPGEVDGKLAERKVGELKFYDGLTHQSMFTHPKHIRKALEAEKSISTDGNPVFMPI
ncbi:MAG: polyamine aminopropyltransferase [Candidatus Hecatellaceae archaeon]|mgnify:CR=1 FL=1